MSRPSEPEASSADASRPHAPATTLEDGPCRDHAEGFRRWLVPERRFLLILVALALVTRLLWVLLIHPPGQYVYSDMRMYVLRAVELAEHGITPQRSLAWQAFGTHYLLSIPFHIFGTDKPWGVPFGFGGVMFGLCSAGAVVLLYLVACRLLPRPWMAKAAGIVGLCWYPNLSTAGFFLSEPPFLLFNLWTTYCLLRVVQEGKRAWAAGVLAGITFMLRPQSAIFFMFAALVWLVNARALRRRSGVGVRHLLAIALPMALALGFSMWRFHVHTGRWGGIAENGTMNLTTARCHNIVTQAFKHKRALLRSRRNNNTRDGRRVSIPGFRVLRSQFPDDSWLGLRPAMGEKTIRFVGYIGDADVHRELRRECYRRTGVIEQLRYSLVNLSLQWFIAKQWPTNERGRETFLPITEVFRHLFQVLVLVPSLIGLGRALRRVRRDPAWALVAVNLLSIMVIAAVFFGDPRLRTPYDPYALLLALPLYFQAFQWLRARRRARRSRAAAPSTAKPDAPARVDADGDAADPSPAGR